MKKVLLTLLCTMAATSAYSSDIRPAVVYGTAGKYDKSFNEAAFKGADRFKADTGIDFREFEPRDDTQGEQALRNFASRGFSPIVAVSFTWTAAVDKVSAEYPDTQFVLIDAVVEKPNVRSVTYRENEGSYLVGIVAAMASKSGTIGFIGGMDIPLIRKFSCGYEQGARAARPEIKILQNMAGTTSAAWNDPVKGAELAKGQMDQNADVMYVAAGVTGIGALQAIADAHKLSIGVDANQNYMHPGSVLTSMVKRVDLSVYNALSDARAGKFSGENESVGVADEAVGWAVDDYNRSLISPEMETAVSKAKVEIASGDLKIHDYMTDNKCPK